MLREAANPELMRPINIQYLTQTQEFPGIVTIHNSLVSFPTQKFK